MPTCVGLIMASCLFLSVPQLQVEYNWTGLNVKLLDGYILLFWIGIILVSSSESQCSSCKRQVVFNDICTNVGRIHVEG
jgi:hypothetical protein